MSIPQALTLLATKDTESTIKGLTLIINAAGTSANLPEILKNDIPAKLMGYLSSNNIEIALRSCWALANLCSQEQGRVAVHKAGVINHLLPLFNLGNAKIVEKSCWILTNITKIPQAQTEIAQSTVPSILGKLLQSPGVSDEQKVAMLQPLSNISLSGPNQIPVSKSGAIPAVVSVLQSGDQNVKQLALNFICNLTTTHDSVRDAVIDAKALPSLATILQGEGTPQMMEMAINCLINLSNTEKGELAILSSKAINSVLGLLYSEEQNMVEKSTMLLSNLVLKKEIREEIRYLGWVEPLSSAIQKGNQQFLEQALRVVINISFDGHCRYLMVRENFPQLIGTRAKSIQAETLTKLTVQALQNFKVPVGNDVEKEVEEAVSSGKIQKIQPPRAKQAQQKKDDFEGLDDLLSGIANM